MQKGLTRRPWLIFNLAVIVTIVVLDCVYWGIISRIDHSLNDERFNGNRGKTTSNLIDEGTEDWQFDRHSIHAR